MEFVVENSGKINIIFLHGWGADYLSFYFLKNKFLNYKLHFANLDGFGKTNAPQDPTINGYAQRLHKYINSNNLSNIILVGHSFGGRVAIEYSSKYQILGLVLVDSAGIKPKFSLKKQFKIVQYKITKVLAKRGLLNHQSLKNFGSADYKNSSPQMQRVLKSCVNYNQKPLLKNINAKTLIIWGQKDLDTPIYMANTLHKHIKNSKLIVLKNCGHFSFLDNQYLFYLELKNFIDNLKGELYE